MQRVGIEENCEEFGASAKRKFLSFRDEETIRQAIVRVINDKINHDDWSTRRRLYEVIHDASWALVEYERTTDFIYPKQLIFGFIKRDGKRKIKQWHWQNPSEGFHFLN